MNKIVYKIALLLFLLASCDNDFLDTIPNDRLASEIFWQNINDAKLAVNSLYNDIDGPNIITWDAMTDIAHTNNLQNTQVFIELGTYDIANEKILAEWTTAYRGIRATSFFLENVGRIPPGNEAIINQYTGEAKVLRAYQYIKLASFFGDVPLVTTSVSIEESRTLFRTPVEEIWDFIDTELTEAASLLPATYAAAEKGRVTSGAAWALKARANLYAGRYQPAIEACQNVTGYSLYSSYKNLFKYVAENNSEVILDKQYIKDNYANNIFTTISPYSQKNSGSGFVPTKTIIDMYEMAAGGKINDPGSTYDVYNPYNDRDPRLRFSIYVDGDTLPSGTIFRPAPNSGGPDAIGATWVNSSTGFNIRKYINNEDFANPANGGINMILLRYAEVLLTYAEAKIELNQLDQTVYDAINAVRNQRQDVKMPSITGGKSQAELREIVRQERTIELAFEGQHFFDTRRWETTETVMNAPVYGMTYMNSGTLDTVMVVGVNRSFDKTKHYLWPIPLTERNLNSNLTQNPNW